MGILRAVAAIILIQTSLTARAQPIDHYLWFLGSDAWETPGWWNSAEEKLWKTPPTSGSSASIGNDVTVTLSSSAQLDTLSMSPGRLEILGTLTADYAFLGEDYYRSQRAILNVTGGTLSAAHLGIYSGGVVSVTNGGKILFHEDDGYAGTWTQEITATVSGAGSRWESRSISLGSSSVTVSNGGTFQADSANINAASNPSFSGPGTTPGQLTIDGVGSRSLTGYTNVGGYGDGAFRVVNGATAGAYTLEVGYGNQGEGEVVVSGIGSRLDSENLDVALNKGRGTLKIENGAEVHAFWSYIGQGEESVGEAQVVGPSRLYTSELHVGASGGEGTLSLENMTGAGTAYASSYSLTVGQGAGSEGRVVVGVRSRMDLDGPLEIGTEGGSGRLTLDQGTAQAKSTVIIGKNGGTGILNIQSQGRFAVSKDVVVGQNGGSGTINLRSEGEMILFPPMDETLRFILAEGEYSHGVMNIGTGGRAGTFEQYTSNYEIRG